MDSTSYRFHRMAKKLSPAMADLCCRWLGKLFGMK